MQVVSLTSGRVLPQTFSIDEVVPLFPEPHSSILKQVYFSWKEHAMINQHFIILVTSSRALFYKQWIHLYFTKPSWSVTTNQMNEKNYTPGAARLERCFNTLNQIIILRVVIEEDILLLGLYKSCLPQNAVRNYMSLCQAKTAFQTRPKA